MLKKSLLMSLGIILIIVVIGVVGWQDIKATLLNVNLFFLIALCFFQLFTISLIGYQWYYLLNKFRKGLPFFQVMGIYLAGSLIESVTPSAKFGGEATKLYLFRKHFGMDYQQLTSVMLVHKYFSLVPFFIVSVVVLVLASFSFEIPLTVYTTFLLLTGLFGLIFWLFYRLLGREVNSRANFADTEKGKLSQFLFKIKKGIDFISKAMKEANQIVTKGDMLLLFMSFLFIWIMYPIKVFLIVSLLGYEASFVLVAVATFSAYIVSMLPLLPGGLGTFEGTMVLIFSMNGFTVAEGLAIALLCRFITYWFPLFFSGITTALLFGGVSGKVIESKV